MNHKRKIFLVITIITIVSFQALNFTAITSGKTKKVAAEWNFIAIGDSRQQYGTWDGEQYTHDNSTNPIRAALVNTVVENNPESEFIIHTGDMVMSGGEQDEWDRFFEDMENVTASGIPVYYAVGNHEIYTYSRPGNYGSPDDDFSTYLANVDMPGNERYYSFDYNDQIHFIVINTEEFWTGGEFQITAEQSSWIEDDLENSALDFTVAMFHRPCYSVRDSGRVEDATAVRNVLSPLLMQYGVDLVFSGHDHYYYRTIRNGIGYVTAGGGGANLYTNNDISEWQDGDVYFSDYHYCNVTVTEVNGGGSVQVDTVRFNYDDGSTTIADSFVIPFQASTTLVSVPLLPVFLGLIVIINFRKRREMY